MVDVVARTVELNLRFHREMGRLTLRFLEDATGVGVDTVRGVVEALRGNLTASPAQSAPGRGPERGADSTLVLEAAAGEVARGIFVVENTLPRAISTRFVVNGVVGGGIAFEFEPDVLDLEPREQKIVRVLARIHDALEIDVTHRGEVSVLDLPGTRIPIVVRRISAAARPMTTPVHEETKGESSPDDGSR